MQLQKYWRSCTLRSITNDSVETLLEIMEALHSHEEELSIRTIAECCSASKSTVHRLLQALHEKGWIWQNSDSKSYRIGLRFLIFANEWRLQLELLKQMDAPMHALVDQCGQTAILNILDGTQGICVHKVEAKSPIRLASNVGHISPLHAGASGKVLLAYAPDEVRELVLNDVEREAFTPKTLLSREALLQEIALIRKNGYATSVEEIDPGAAAISVPLLGPTGQLIAGLTIAGVRFSFEKNMDKWIGLLLRTISQISMCEKGQPGQEEGSRSIHDCGANHT